ASETSRELPGYPDSSAQGGTCLCHGAIVIHATFAPNIDDGLVTYVPLDALLLAGKSLFIETSGLPRACTVCHFPSVESGRIVRALIESLLI
ncbi:MAG TPA: hypothetical protein VIH42_05875, partial [Thermoguttaceae bacterium]